MATQDEALQKELNPPFEASKYQRNTQGLAKECHGNTKVTPIFAFKGTNHVLDLNDMTESHRQYILLKEREKSGVFGELNSKELKEARAENWRERQ